MTKRRQKTEIDHLIKELQVEDLRLRIGIPDSGTAKKNAIENLKAISNKLVDYIAVLER